MLENKIQTSPLDSLYTLINTVYIISIIVWSVFYAGSY